MITIDIWELLTLVVVQLDSEYKHTIDNFTSVRLIILYDNVLEYKN